MAKTQAGRLKEDEKGVLEAESALAREEQRLWQKLDRMPSDGTDGRRKALEARLDSLASHSQANAADVRRARDLWASASEPSGPYAEEERSASVQARRAALQARELAQKALTSALARAETARQQRLSALDQAEKLVQGIENDAEAAAGAARAAKERAEAEQRAAEEARRAEEAARSERERKEAQRRSQTDDFLSHLRTEREGREADQSASDAASVAAAPGSAAAPQGTADPRAFPAAAPAAGRPAAQAPQTLSTGTLKKLSRRRRVKLAPPPKKIEVEVQTYGENTFYTGFSQTLDDGGLFVVSLETLPEGHELDLDIVLEGQRMKSRGKVEFVRVDNLANPECTQGAGIRLSGLSREAQRNIETFFQKRPPMFFLRL